MECFSFEEMAEKVGVRIFEIKEGYVEARGIYVPDTLFSYDDNGRSVISYPDTGVFVLFRGSHAECTADKYKDYIDHAQNTTREIVFQSRNAAAQFVLGERGRTSSWRTTD